MKIRVAETWLKACGRERLAGLWLEVVKVDDYGERRGKFYTAKLPEGGDWTVWDLRGVEVAA